jgi:thioredoxin reductase
VAIATCSSALNGRQLARYRRLAVENLETFEGASVHYWASPLEAKLCAGQEVALVGAGNSAGQAAVYLASQVAKVWLRRPHGAPRCRSPRTESPD